MTTGNIGSENSGNTIKGRILRQFIPDPANCMTKNSTVKYFRMGQASIPSFCLYIHIHQYIQIVKYHLPGNKPPPEGCQENAHAQQSEKTFIFSERLPYHTPALDRLGQALFAHAMMVFILGRTMLIQVKHCTVVLAWHESVLLVGRPCGSLPVCRAIPASRRCYLS